MTAGKIDLSKVRDKLKNLQSKGSGGNDFWKPTESKSIVRILPYKHNPGYPFMELFFHYTLGRGILSPKSVGKQDPIFELAMKLRKSGDKEDFVLAKKLFPKMRVYAPVIVRGEEDQGVKFWGFSKTIYESLLALINDEEYGDITDPSTGTDIIVEYQTPEEANNDYGKTSVRAKRKSSLLSEDSDEAKKWMEEQKDILEIYTVPTNEELEEKVKAWLSSDESKTEVEDKPQVETKSEEVKEEETEKNDKQLDKFTQLFDEDD